MTDGSTLGALKNPRNRSIKVNLPYDASVHAVRDPQEPNGAGNGYFHEDNYVYRKMFEISSEDKGKAVWFEFEGVYQNAFVYINNAYVGKCPYGYGNFYVNGSRMCLTKADLQACAKRVLSVIMKSAVYCSSQ